MSQHTSLESAEVRTIMEPLQVPVLRGIAKKLGIPREIQRKPELIAALGRFLTTHTQQFVEALTQTERRLLAELVHGGNQLKLADFANKYQIERPVLYATAENCRPIHLVVTWDKYERDHGQAVIPSVLADLLRPFLKEPDRPKVTKIAEIPATLAVDEKRYRRSADVRPIHITAGEQTVFVELRRVLHLVQGGKLRVQPKSGRPTPATVRAMSEALAAPDLDLELPKAHHNRETLIAGPIRAYAWTILLQQCGWCRASGETLKLTKDGQHLLHGPSPEAFRDGVMRLCFDDRFDELTRIDHIRGQTGNARRWLSDPSERRDEILEGMASWPVNEWLEFHEARRFLSACGNWFEVPENSMALYFAEQRYGYLSDDNEIGRQYLRVFLMESLATLGLVDVAYVYPHYLWPEFSGNWGTDDLDFCGRYDGLLYVRLTGLGAFCVGSATEYKAPAAERRKLFAVVGDGEIVIAEGQTPTSADVAMLELFSSREHQDRFRVATDRTLDYMESGGSLDDLLAYLEENSANDIPASFRERFEALQAQVNSVTGMEDAWLIEFASPRTAATVTGDPQAGKLCVPAGATCVAVAKSREKAFRAAIKKLGYVLPR